jgi:hypothetical protein
MRVGPLASLRIAVLALGFTAGPLLVRALDRGLAREPRPITAGHLLLGTLVAAVAQPGPLLGILVKPSSGEKARGLAVGGCAVTALAALFAGTLLYSRIFVVRDGGLPEGVTFLWAVAALPLAALDFLRLRGGAGAA